MTAQSLGAAS